MDPVCIKTYANQFDAEQAALLLREQHIDAFLSSDDLGGAIPGSFAIGGTRLFVDAASVDHAITILKGSVDASES